MQGCRVGRRCFLVLLPVNVFGARPQQHIRPMVMVSVWECYFLWYGFELSAFVSPYAAWLLFWRLSSHGPCPTKPRSSRIVWGTIISVTCVLLTFWVYKVCVLVSGRSLCHTVYGFWPIFCSPTEFFGFWPFLDLFPLLDFSNFWSSHDFPTWVASFFCPE